MVEEPKDGVVDFRRVYISMSTLRTIFQESKKSLGNETGGALVGTVNEDRIYVMEASGPGRGAVSTVASFSPDIRHLEDFVNYFEERGFLFVGQWHKHPSCIRGPSGGDKAQIVEILKDNPHLNFFVNIISTPTELGFRVSATIFFRDETTRFNCFPRINAAQLFLESDAPQLVMPGVLAEKSESDIVIREIETPGEKILPAAEVCVAENQEVLDAGVSKDIMVQRWLRGGRKGLVGEIYGCDKVAALLEEKILREKKLMELLFPEFKLRVKKTPGRLFKLRVKKTPGRLFKLRVKKTPGRLFWFTVFHAHEVALVLENNGTYTILIDPEVEKIDLGEKVFKSALVAALIAKASILSKQLVG